MKVYVDISKIQTSYFKKIYKKVFFYLIVYNSQYNGFFINKWGEHVKHRNDKNRFSAQIQNDYITKFF